jgi:uncharacterized repeat protein (TIGR01451 family)
VTISNITGNGTLGISLAANTATDQSGHEVGTAGPSATVQVRGARVLQVGLSGLPRTVRPNQIVQETVSFANVGNQTATGMVVRMSLPAGARFNPARSTQGWVARGGGLFTFQVGTVAAGGHGTLRFPFTVGRSKGPGRLRLTSRVTVRDNLSGNLDLGTASASTLLSIQ